LFEVTGVTASTDTVETLVTMGMGLLAGSTVMLLTLIWGSVVAFGSYDLSQPSAADSSNVENKTPFSLTGFFLYPCELHKLELRSIEISYVRIYC
jgi:Ca2+/Na+ antiporter